MKTVDVGTIAPPGPGTSLSTTSTVTGVACGVVVESFTAVGVTAVTVTVMVVDAGLPRLSVKRYPTGVVDGPSKVGSGAKVTTPVVWSIV